MGRRIVKIIRIVLLAAIVLLAVVLASGVLLYPKVFAPRVNAYLHDLVQRTLEQQFQREVAVGDVRLTFPNPQLLISDLAIAREQKLADGTLLVVQTIKARVLLKSLAAKEIVIDQILLEQPSIWVEFDEQGRSNLPDFSRDEPQSESPPKQGSRFQVGALLKRLVFPRIELEDASIHFVHQQLPLKIDVERLSTKFSFDLQKFSARGTIALEGGEFEWQDRGTIRTSLSGSIAFEQNALSLSEVDIQANSTHMAVDGTVTNLTRPELDLQVTTELALEELDNFLRLNQNLRGMAAFDGNVTGPVPDIIVTGHLTCNEGNVWKLDFANVSTDVTYQRLNVALKNLAVNIFGGQVVGEGALDFADGPAYQAKLDVERLDVAEANRFVDRELPIAGRMSGSIDVFSETFAFEDLVLQTDLQVEDVDAYGVQVPQGTMRADIREETLFINELQANIFEGTATGDLQMYLSATPNYQAAFDVQNIDLTPIMALIPQPPDVDGRVSGTVQVNGTTFALDDLDLQSSLNVSNMLAYGIAVPTLETTARIQQSSLFIDHLSARLFDGQVAGTGTLVLAGDTLPKFAAQAALQEISSHSVLQQFVQQTIDQSMMFDGKVSGDVSITGSAFALSDITGTIDLSGEGSVTTYDGAVPFHTRVTSTLDKNVVDIAHLEMDSQALKLSTSGTLDLGSQTFEVQYDVASQDVAALLAQIRQFVPAIGDDSPLVRFAGNIEYLRGTIEGPVSSPDVRVETHVTNADLVWARVDDLKAVLLYDGLDLQIQALQAQYKSAQLAVENGSIELGELMLDLPIAIGAGKISDYLAMAKQDLPIQGELKAIKTTLHGTPDNLRSALTVNIVQAIAWNQSIESLSAKVALAGNRVVIDSLTAKKNGGRIEMNGFVGFDSSFEVALITEDLNFRDLDALQDVAVQYQGRANIRLDAGGTFQDPVGSASIELTNLVYQETPIDDVTCTVDMKDQTLHAKLLTFREKFIANVQLALNADLDYRAELLMEEAAVEQVLSIAAKVEGITGIITGKITSEGSLKQLETVAATVQLSTLALDIFGQKVTNYKAIDIVVTPQRFTVNSLDLRGKELGLFAQGTLDFQGNFDLAVDGIVDLRPFLAFIPESSGIRSLAGHLQVICNVRGTFLQPEIEGLVELLRGSIQVQAYPDPIRNIQGKVAFSPGKVEILQMQGNVSSGSFSTSGVMRYKGLTVEDFIINVVGEKIVMEEVVEDLNMTVSPQIQISGGLTQQEITGKVLVDTALYSKDLDIQSLVGNKSRKISLDSSQSNGTLTFDLFISAPKDIQVRNRYAEIDLRADLRVQGTPANPQIEGRVEILRGNVQFGDIRYRIVSGVIDFADPLRLNPDINIRVETMVQEYQVSLGIEGDLDQFTLDMQSDPELSKAQITRLLAAGSGSAGNGYDFVTKPLQTLVEGEIEKITRLDRFSVDVDPLLSGADGTEASPRVTLGKRFFQDLLLTFSTTVGGSDASQLVEIEYRLSDRLSLTASRNDKGEIDTSFTFKLRLDER